MEVFQGYALTPETYDAKIDADASSAKSFQESVDNMTKSASFPTDKDPRSLSMKLARAAEMVYLSA
ncbi:TonB-dependent receptor [Sesbania bispinosa]|nr:TonB-dependent receptor [Sesbania bispinosa]